MARFGKIWQDVARFDKGDMSRFGRKDLTRGAMARLGKI